jgi:hypothetical protein
MMKRISRSNDIHWSMKRKDEILAMDLCRSHLFNLEEVKGVDVIHRVSQMRRSDQNH